MRVSEMLSNGDVWGEKVAKEFKKSHMNISNSGVHGIVKSIGYRRKHACFEVRISMKSLNNRLTEKKTIPHTRPNYEKKKPPFLK